MKFNKWTVALAAVGAVSLTSVAQAEEKMMLGSRSELTSTTISGYVDASAQWNLKNNGTLALPQYAFGGAAKADGFNLNVVQLTVAKALDESEWSAGYRADLWFGPDAVTLATQGAGGDLAIRQAYVALRTPVGNGIDWKLGVFDTIVGYETLESGNNPNFTRSYGFSIEPTTHTGLLATYRFCDAVSASLGVVNSFGPQINTKAQATGQSETFKTYMGSIALTAPSDWGWVAGSSLYAGIISGYDANVVAPGNDGHRQHYYLGATVSTPVTGLKVGAALDFNHIDNAVTTQTADQQVYGIYASFQATEKLSLHTRGEYVVSDQENGRLGADIYEVTVTAQYDLWKNVISRAEFRWDHTLDERNGTGFGVATNPRKDALLLAANVIYKF